MKFLARIKEGSIPELLTKGRRIVHNLRWGSALIGFCTPLLVAGGYAVFAQVNGNVAASVNEQTSQIGRRDIVSTIKALGKVTLANEQQMRFNVLGEVENVHVKEGDEVKRGDLIAELDKTDPLADIRQAELSVADAWLRLQELDAGKEQQLLSAQNAVRVLERNLEEGYGELPSERKQVDFDIEQARRTMLEKESAVEKAQRDLAMTIEDGIADTDNLLDDIFGVLSGDEAIRGATRYETFAIDFLFNDQSLKNKVEFAFYDATNAFNAIFANQISMES